MIGQSIVALYAIVAVRLFNYFSNFVIRYLNFQVKFLLGYVMCLSAMFQIFLPCFLAQILILKGDKLYEKVCKISWYSMAQSDKKSMALLMLATAEPQSLLCGPKEINLQMFVEVLFDRRPFRLLH